MGLQKPLFTTLTSASHHYLQFHDFYFKPGNPFYTFVHICCIWSIILR
jgi:hypothetical protein